MAALGMPNGTSFLACGAVPYSDGGRGASTIVPEGTRTRLSGDRDLTAVHTMSRRQILAASGALLLAGCTSVVPASDAAPSLRPDSPMAANAALGIWPDVIAKSPAAVRAAYAYAAAAGPSALQYIPCYCGCGNLGHKDNLACYVQRFAQDGWIVADAHATGCGVCVGITQDVMAMEQKGVALKEIRRAVDAKWAQSGPGTPTRMP